jgi:hypothetical protein
MKSNEAPGVDTVPMEMWRELVPEVRGQKF